MGKHGKPPVINNINELNLEIDYDKLADAIVKAQKRAESEAMEDAAINNRKTNLFIAIGRILIGRRSKDGSFLSAPYVPIVSMLYRVIAIFGVVLMIAFWVTAAPMLTKLLWQGWAIAVNIIAISFMLFITFVLFLYMVMFWGAANDMEYETDKNYIMSVFSGLVSIASLIVAIIALYRDVG